MKILVNGGGISNLALIRHLDKLSIQYDTENKEELYDYIVKSPGTLLENCPQNGKIVSDIEMIYILHKPKIIGVTGSNGKTTTTLLIYEMLKHYINLKLGGNIGIPFSNVYDGDQYTYLLELSSFELETCEKLKCHVAVMLNINYCHMDHHKSYIDYIDSKFNIINNQTEEDYIIYNYDDPILFERLCEYKGNKLSFSMNNKEADMYIDNGSIYYKNYQINLDFVSYQSNFDLQNIMASLLVLDLYQVDLYELIDSINRFKKPKYRLEKLSDFVYNDAKSTNVFSTIEALKSLGMVNLILGGYDRGEDYSPLFEYKNLLKECFIYGENKDKIKKLCKENNVKCHTYKTLKKATLEALKKEGVLLYSPASASFDQYQSYLERGSEFEIIVKDRI